MDGSDEGVFAWMTVNFLLGALGGTGIQNTVPTIDLGGGSMQLTFHPKDSSTIRKSLNSFFHALTPTLAGVSALIKSRKIDFVGKRIAESTAYFSYNPEYQFRTY